MKINRLSYLSYLVCGLLVLSWHPAWAEEGVQEVGKVTAVEVEGNKIVSTSVILSKIKTRPGDPWSQSTLDEDIKRLYGTGFFTHVSTQVRPYQDGVLVRFLLVERPLVERVVITGQRYVRIEKIREVLKTKEQELLDHRELKQDIERIKQLYRTKGFYLAQVFEEVKVDEATHRATVFLTIKEGGKIRVRRIHFDGNVALSDRRLRKAIATKQAWWFSGGYYRPEVLEEDVERIKDLYRLEGYSDVRVSAQADFDPTQRWLTVLFRIEEGPQYRVGTVSFRGIGALPQEEVARAAKVASGDPFSEKKVFEDVGRIQSVYFAKGYMSASVEPTTVLNPDTRRVDVIYQVSEGSVAYVGGISIQGNVKTRDAVIRREIRIYPGERYDGEKLRRSKERLYNLGYFEEVNFETVPSAERPDHRDLVVSVKEAKTGEFSFGGGFSSVDNFIGFVEIAQRNFDLFNWPTFTGGGQDLSFRVMAGTRRRNFELSFTEPWIFDRPYSAGFDLFNTTRTRGEGYSFELKRTGGALRLGHAIGDYNRVGLTYRLEAVHVSDVAESASAALKREIGESTVSSLRLSYTRDTRDNTFNPKRGYLLDNGIELAGSVLGGDRDFWRWTGSGSIFFQPFVEDQVLELRGSLGLADAMADSDFVPIFQRFFAGGADSIRGYRERRVGPKDPSTRDPVGGEAVAVFNAEYTVPVVEFLKVAGFYDIGNVWASLGDFASGGFRSGAGAGVRIKTPFGPVKLDYGWPINPERGERRNGRFHFSASRAF